MENHKRICGVGKIQLPHELILHIRSLMSEREAARTTLVSKSWYNAWSTRPNLSFNRYDFDMWDDQGCFSEFTTKTMQKYEDLNLKIESFRIQTITEIVDGNSMKHVGHSLVKELMLRAIKLGATDIEIVLPHLHSAFVLPGEVLESKALTRLSLTGLRVDLRDKRVACSNLKYLNLHHMIVYGDLFRDFILRCPLIEELTFVDTKCTKQDEGEGGLLNRADGGTIKSDKIHDNLKYLCLEYDYLESLFINGYKYLECVFPSLRNDVHIHVHIHVLRYGDNPSGCMTSWFSMLSKLLKMLSQYSTYLTIDVKRAIRAGRYVHRCIGNIDSLITPSLETLTLNGEEVNDNFMGVLSLIFRPKKTIIQEDVKMECKRVDVKVMEERFDKRRNLPWIKEMDTSVRNRFISFQLRWN